MESDWLRVPRIGGMPLCVRLEYVCWVSQVPGCDGKLAMVDGTKFDIAARDMPLVWEQLTLAPPAESSGKASAPTQAR